MKSHPEIKNLLPDELAEKAVELGLPRYRADQLISWIYEKNATEWDSMTNLSKELRARMGEWFTLKVLRPEKTRLSADGARKYLFKLPDGNRIESVLIPDGAKRTLCISTQVGCALGCAFCRTGTLGFKRNLETWEIIEQVLAVRRDRPPDEAPSNIVLMGMGEPLFNYHNVVCAAKLMTYVNGLNLSHRKITLSTVGIPEQIDKLARDNAPLSIAISVNAPDNETRSKIMPVNKKYPLDETLEALTKFPLSNNNRATFEYVMLAGVNDSPLHARRLANKIKRFPCKVNLIAFNPFPGTDLKPSPRHVIEEFQAILRAKNLSAFIRKSRGADILAACGQLAGEN